MRGLKGKVAWVTGAGSVAGIGFASAKRMAEDGARVVLTDINGEGIAARVKELNAAGHDAIGFTQDVTSESMWKSTLASVLAVFGQLDILVNNAGVAILGEVGKLTLDDWNRQIAINQTSVFLGCHMAIEQMRKQGGGGVIVNVSSIAGLIGMPSTTAYAASKGGVRMMNKALAIECAREGIRVNSVHPGVIKTDIQKVVIHDTPEVSKAIEASIPMGRMGAPDDIGAMIAFLASEDAKYVTGGEFVVDGGLTAQ